MEAFGTPASPEIDSPHPAPAQGVPESGTAGAEKKPFREGKKREAETGVKQVVGNPQGPWISKDAVEAPHSPFRLFPAALPHKVGAGEPEGGGKGLPSLQRPAEENRRKAVGTAPRGSEGEGGVETPPLHVEGQDSSVSARQGFKKRRGQQAPP